MIVDILTEKVDNCSILQLGGEIDASSALLLDRAIDQILQEDNSHLILNCTDLHYISSAGLGVLISKLKDLQQAKRKVVLVEVDPDIMDVFTILGLENHLVFAPDLRTAIARCS